MSTHVVFKDVSDHLKARLEAYWARKLPRLQKFLVPYRTDAQEIDLAVYAHQQNPQREWYEARAVIHLPTGSLAAQGHDKSPEAVLDQVADALAGEIKRHKEHVRRDYLFRRRARSRADVSAAGPLLQRDQETGRREAFFRLLRPLLRFLRDHARRELHILERDRVLQRREPTVADLLDQVVALAWERFAQRPQQLPLDLWLLDLLHETLEPYVKQEPRPYVALEEKADRVLPDKVPQADEEREWWSELLGYDDQFLLEDLIPDMEASEAWDQLDAEEQHRRLLTALAKLPARQRQAFLLAALEDYNTAEIAMLQDRPENEVKADIEAARRTLRQRLLGKEGSTQARQVEAVIGVS